MDFVSDALFDGRRFRALTLVDNSSRECLAIRADQRLQGEDVATILDPVAAARGTPKRICGWPPKVPPDRFSIELSLATISAT